MVNVTISISEELRDLMKKHSEINWSAFIRRCISERAHEIAKKEEIRERLSKEKEFNEWAVNLVRKGRHKNETSG